ncbi:large T antigen [Rhinolophus simulator polyomavirus 1]|uniref:hypothetical protein n=1 Tax=Rhinolophus simulator polyomavirus 1 TaxID=2029304 RepID=UPI000B601A6C|nr:large T antigen [Rhinolophus simulator polyomavirus 1]BAZ96586.1 large T antigen [Rhinolophus simulator polyomavirus 1]
MDRFLTRDEMKELMELLNVPAHCYGNMSMLKINYRKMSKIYHPDKGGDGTKMQRMNVLWQKLCDNICSARQESGYQHPPYGSESWEQWWHDFNRGWDDLFCAEDLSSSDEDGPASSSTGQSNGHDSRQPGSSQSSFATPPKPKKPKTSHVPNDFPSELSSFLSNAVYSNKTVSAFLIYTTKEKGELLYEKIDKFKPDFKSRHAYEEAALLFIMTPGKHRVSAIKNFCLTHCTVSFLLCKAVTKPIECYRVLKQEPFAVVEESKQGLYDYEFYDGEKAPTVDWNKLAEFAVDNRLDDPLIIMAFYLDFATDPDNCPKCNGLKMKMHYKFHAPHHKNAVLFKECKTQKTVCQQAADVVTAKTRLKLLESTREDLLSERIMLVFENLAETFSPLNILYYMAGVAWYSQLFEDVEEKLYKILQLLVENVPKKRNVLFRGPINSGKTTFAAAILDLVGGKTLNINCPAEKLGFELGCAIDQFAVIFEDVKGQIAMNKSLHPGQGVCNLDNLRDYLDGSVRVNLEKKHVNKKSQIFPPSIVTMNEYVLPQTLLTRFSYILNFMPKDYLKKSLEASDVLGRKRILQSSCTLLLLLVYHLPTSRFNKSLHQQVNDWKETIDKHVGMGKYIEMQGNIQNGRDPLHDIVVDDDEE